MTVRETLIGTHWGNYLVTSDGRTISGVRPAPTDSHPSPIGQVLLNATDTRHRVMQPMVREGYLHKRRNNREARGQEPFVAIPWDEALDLAADALRDTIATHGNQGIFGGSYGWSSAGRFHHAQSQVHRFLNMLGGYVYSVNSYSAAAAEVIVKHILGSEMYTTGDELVAAQDIPDHCDLYLAFGGICPPNHQVMPGGTANHLHGAALERQKLSNTQIINIGPNRDDVPDDMAAEWLPVRPGTDTALLLALAHTVETTGRVDRTFLDSHTVGYATFRDYLLGVTDGVAKDAAWAAPICGVPRDTIDALAKRLCATNKSLISVALSLQRAEHGEQPFWMAVTLSAMLGTFGQKGCGVGLGWASNGMGFYGRKRLPFRWAALPQGTNGVADFIPVARIADMLLCPGEPFDFNGREMTYPDIDLVYWAGGNPFHHHQDLHRLREAFRKPTTVIVNESAWTATAQHADIVFPACTMLERNDLVCGRDVFMTPSQQALEPVGEARSDFAIFSALSARLGTEGAFTNGLDEMGWLRTLYDQSRAAAAKVGVKMPDFDTFWASGQSLDLTDQIDDQELPFEAYRRDPVENALATTSGRIEIFSKDIAAFGYADCQGFPQWFDKSESLGAATPPGDYPLNLLSPQPANRLHSQFTFAHFSQKDMIKGKEVVELNTLDATSRGIKSGDLVRIYNDRGASIAGARLSDAIMSGVAVLPTGAWFHTEGWGRGNPDLSGNPNAVTRDIGTSQLAQGPTAQSCMVQIERVNS